jgi:hypothetical protein
MEPLPSQKDQLSAYNLEKMNSLGALEKILLVMDYIMARAEIGDLGLRIVLWEGYMSIRGVSYQDLRDIVDHLFAANILKDKEMILHKSLGESRGWYGSDYYVTIDYDEFDKFRKNLTDRIKELKGGKQNNAGRLEFDEPNSILMINEYKIPIARRKEKTDEHDVLKWLFKDKNDECFYSELSESILEVDNEEYKNNQKYWQKFYGACERIQEKVSKATENSINDFLDFNSGIKGRVKINRKYIV